MNLLIAFAFTAAWGISLRWCYVNGVRIGFERGQSAAVRLLYRRGLNEGRTSWMRASWAVKQMELEESQPNAVFYMAEHVTTMVQVIAMTAVKEGE